MMAGKVRKPKNMTWEEGNSQQPGQLHPPGSVSLGMWHHYQCGLCKATFETDEGLTSHMKSHTPVLKYECSKCAQAFSVKAMLAEHMLSHFPDSDFGLDEEPGHNYIQCSQCEMQCDGPDELMIHMKVHRSVMQFKCNLCKETFFQPNLLDAHMLSHTLNATHTCHLCNANFATSDDLNSHINVQHPDLLQSELLHQVADTSYKCTVCDAAFREGSQLSAHLLMMHDQDPVLPPEEVDDLTCLTCYARFEEAIDLDNHLLTHIGKVPYQCNLCPRKFNLYEELTRHTLAHAGVKPYKCEECGKSFVDRLQLKNHIYNQHSKPLLYECALCTKSFAQSSCLKLHIMTHTGERPFKCSQCPKAFVSGSKLAVHTRTHTGEKPYRCEWCHKTFATSCQVGKHARIHTGQKPYECSECGRKFAHRESLNRHMRTHTGEKPYKCDQCPRAFTTHTQCSMHIKLHAQGLIVRGRKKRVYTKKRKPNTKRRRNQNNKWRDTEEESEREQKPVSPPKRRKPLPVNHTSHQRVTRSSRKSALQNIAQIAGVELRDITDKPEGYDMATDLYNMVTDDMPAHDTRESLGSDTEEQESRSDNCANDESGMKKNDVQIDKNGDVCMNEDSVDNKNAFHLKTGGTTCDTYENRTKSLQGSFQQNLNEEMSYSKDSASGISQLCSDQSDDKHNTSHSHEKLDTDDVESQSSGSFQCKVCTKTFEDSADLEIHAAIHKAAAEDGYENVGAMCPKCGRILEGEIELMVHQEKYHPE